MTAELNIALGRPAFMSSVYKGKEASLVNDGIMCTNFHTNCAPLPHWWAIDFGLERSRFARVRVTNAGDVGDVGEMQYYRK